MSPNQFFYLVSQRGRRAIKRARQRTAWSKRTSRVDLYSVKITFTKIHNGVVSRCLECPIIDLRATNWGELDCHEERLNFVVATKQTSCGHYNITYSTYISHGYYKRFCSYQNLIFHGGTVQHSFFTARFKTPGLGNVFLIFSVKMEIPKGKREFVLKRLDQLIIFRSEIL